MTTPKTFAPGDILAERYTLKKTAWSTAVGPLWLARDRVLDRAVFVQLLAPEATRDARSREAFLRIATRVAQVTHPGLLQVFDIGEDPPFAVLEHAAGGLLADRLRAGPLRTTETARAALALARGLEALHERGVWHGYLSPSSVLFDDEGRAKILAIGAMDTWRSIPGADATSEQPEGYRSDDLDAVPADADRFALAALTYHMITGRAPSRPAAPARAVRRDVPADIESLLKRALDTQPVNRPSLDEFEGALASHARFVPPDAKQPRFVASEFRWLAPVIVIVALSVLTLTLGVQFVRGLADREPEATPTSTATQQQGTAIEVQAVSDFDPEGDGQENSEDAGKATDGEALTSWRTVGYRSQDLDKDGVGLLFDLGEETALARVRVLSGLPGWQAQIRVATSEADGYEDYRQVASFTAGTEGIVPIPSGTRARFVLLWIVRLAEQSGEEYPYRAEVAEAEFFAR